MDRKLNEVDSQTVISKIIGINSAGDVVQISVEDLKNMIRPDFFINDTNNDGIADLDAFAGYGKNGLYNVQDNAVGTPFPGTDMGVILLYMCRNGYFYQECICVKTGERKSRWYSSSWSEWKEF